MMYTRFPSIFDADFFSDLDNLFSSNSLSYKDVFPPTNMFCGEDGSVLLEFATAGYKKEELSVSVKENKVIIEGKPEETDALKGSYYQQKIKKAAFTRVYGLPGNVYDFENATVNYENGLLQVTIPRKESEKPVSKKLEIQ